MRNYKRLMLGDVFEIAVSDNQVAYAQYIYNSRTPPVMGNLIRVFPGIYDLTSSKNIHEITQLQESFLAFFPACSALRYGTIRTVSRELIPDRLKSFDCFRSYYTNPKTGEKMWWIWEEAINKRIDRLLPEHADLPLMEIISLGELIRRINMGWTFNDLL